MKTVAVFGLSYGGAWAACQLSQALPKGWRVVAIDRNSHMNHLYVLPRFAVVPGHSYKAFIPYNKLFEPLEAQEPPSPHHVVLQAQITSFNPKYVTLDREFPEHGIAGEKPTLHFDYAVYALGSHLPAPIDLWGPVGDEVGEALSLENLSISAPSEDVAPWAPHTADLVSTPSVDSPVTLPLKSSGPIPIARGSKADGIDWLSRYRLMLERTPSILVVGGGALGIQFATDIAEVFPTKPVTILHSRPTLLHKYEGMHDEIVAAMSALNVSVILNDRLDLSFTGKTTLDEHGNEVRVVRTKSGREIQAGLVLLCTGQSPNSTMIQEAIPEAIIPDGPNKGLIRIKRTLQVAVPREEEPSENNATENSSDDAHYDVPYPHIFALGDVADAYGAIKAGHTAYYQGEVAAKNIVKLIRQDEGETGEDLTLEKYQPGPPGIKISLGLSKSLWYINGEMGKKEDAPEDLDAPYMWKFFNIDSTKVDMHL